MKITQLPKATAVTDSDIAVIVQDGETRQILRTLLAPSPPNGLQLDGDTLCLTADGVPVGTGTEIPIPTPWAKQITYNREMLGEKMEITCLRSSGNQNKEVISVYVFLNCATYTETDEGNVSFTPLLSDYRGVNYSPVTSFGLDEKYVDINETFFLRDNENLIAFSVKDFEELAADLLAEFHRSLEVISFSDDGKILLAYQYAYILDKTLVTETEMEGIHEELKTLFEKNTAAFTVRYAEISYSKDAEVIGNV